MQSAPARVPQWSAPGLPPIGDSYLDHIEHNLPVRLIATLGTFTAALADEPVATAVARAVEGRFSFLPVRAGEGGAVVGLFHAEEHNRPSAARVREAMEPLSGNNLIGVGAPLLDFVTTADTNPCRLVLDRADITGLVTLSDLQRLPVRTVLFSMFIHLELLLTEQIKHQVGVEVSPFELLPAVEAKQPRKRWHRMFASGMDRDPYGALDFKHKVMIAQNHLLIDSQDAAGLDQIEKVIRHPIAHARDYAATPAAARAVVRQTRLMGTWIDRLRNGSLGR